MKTLFFGVLLVSLVFVTGCNEDNTTTTTTAPGIPTIISINPAEVSRGEQHVRGTVLGTNLNGATSVSLGDGITVLRVTAVSASQVDIEFSVSENASSGSRTITVTAAGGTATSSALLTVLNRLAPKATFRVEPKTQSISVTITFDATSSVENNKSKLSFKWDFGDGSEDNGKIVEHRYTTVGTYTVALTIKDERGSTNTATRRLEVLQNAPPVAVIKVTPGLEGNTITEFVFDGTESYDPDGRVTKFLWIFGDGKKALGAKVKHTFGKGEFEVTLTITDNKGVENSGSRKIKVDELTEVKCTKPARNRGFIFGTVLAVEGRSAIVKLPPGSTCANSFYRCADMRRWEPEQFRGIVHEMYDRGNGIFRIPNDCPFRWPPAIGEKVFLYYKSCSINFCP